MIFLKSHTVLIFFLSLPFFSNSQSPVTVKATIDKNKILIGEQIHLKVEATLPFSQPYTILRIDSIEHFEILKTSEPVEKRSEENKTVLQDFLLTSFDSGHWVIPSFRIAGEIFTDTIPVDVVFSNFDPKQDYHDIKDVIDAPAENKKKKDWYWYAAVSTVLIAIAVYLLTRKKKQTAAPSTPIDPYDEARKQLAVLERENISPKLFYSRLVDIFRLYIFRRKGIASLQKTTDDLVLQLKSLDLPAENYNALAQALRLSDFVKFAKYEPGDLDNKTSFLAVKTSIDLIEKTNSPSATGGQ
jgi:hypothetical protein